MRAMQDSKMVGWIFILLFSPSAALALEAVGQSGGPDGDPLTPLLQSCLARPPAPQPLSTASESTLSGGISARYTGSRGTACQISDCRSGAAERVILSLGTCDHYGYGSYSWAVCVQSSFLSSWQGLSSQFDGAASTVSEFGGCQTYNQLIHVDYRRIESEWGCLSGALNQVGSEYATKVASSMNGGSSGLQERLILSTLQESAVSCSGSSTSSSSGGPPSTVNFPGSSSSSSSSSSGAILPPGTVCPAWGCDGPPRVFNPIDPINPIQPGPTPIPTPTFTPTPIRPEPRPIGPEPVRGGPVRFNDSEN